MAGNQIPDARPEFFAFAQHIYEGLNAHGVAVGVLHNTAGNYQPNLDDAVDAESQFNAAQGAKPALAEAYAAADAAGAKFILDAKSVLEISFGRTYNAAWDGTGFPGNSLSVPTTQDARYSLLVSLLGFLSENSDYEVSTNKIVVTSARAAQLITALDATDLAVSNGDSLTTEKKQTRDAAEVVLRRRVRNTIAELGELLGDMDARWAWFGLNMPGAETTPEVVTGLAVTHGLSGELKFSYGGGARATRFRVWIKILTVDADFHAVLTVNVHTATVPSLPVGKTVQAYVTAANDAGESMPSNTVSAVVA
ncbi:MAG: hypothetical protein RLZZ350_276 [Verrucomicrobiota bacterium]|jgi:hypothetical protein